MKTNRQRLYYDPWLLGSALALALMGLLMVASASMVISDRQYHTPFYFLWHQGAYFLLACVLAWCVTRVQTSMGLAYSGYALLFGMFLLVLVLIPGIGRTVNGSRRWLSLGFMVFQASEVVKLAAIFYFAGYLVRRGELLKTQWLEVLKPLSVLGVLALLLLAEPDFGTATVIVITVLGMLFLGGMRPVTFLGMVLLAASCLALLAWISPYRLARLSSFMHPWQQAYSGGYQLTQSLIAVGHGGFWGVGLGNSIQKLFYLPEAHTDFIFAILVEEMGFVGGAAVVLLYGVLVGRMLYMGYHAMCKGMSGHGFVAYGVALWLALQAAINMGVNMGLLPTKGITLPLMSYGGSSLVMCAVAVALVLRIGHEVRCGELQ